MIYTYEELKSLFYEGKLEGSVKYEYYSSLGGGHTLMAFGSTLKEVIPLNEQSGLKKRNVLLWGNKTIDNDNEI